MPRSDEFIGYPTQRMPSDYDLLSAVSSGYALSLPYIANDGQRTQVLYDQAELDRHSATPDVV